MSEFHTELYIKSYTDRRLKEMENIEKGLTKDGKTQDALTIEQLGQSSQGYIDFKNVWEKNMFTYTENFTADKLEPNQYRDPRDEDNVITVNMPGFDQMSPDQQTLALNTARDFYKHDNGALKTGENTAKFIQGLHADGMNKMADHLETSIMKEGYQLEYTDRETHGVDYVMALHDRTAGYKNPLKAKNAKELKESIINNARSGDRQLLKAFFMAITSTDFKNVNMSDPFSVFTAVVTNAANQDSMKNAYLGSIPSDHADVLKNAMDSENPTAAVMKDALTGQATSVFAALKNGRD